MDHVSGAATYKLVFMLFGVAVGAARLVESSDEIMSRTPTGPATPAERTRASAAA